MLKNRLVIGFDRIRDELFECVWKHDMCHLRHKHIFGGENGCSHFSHHCVPASYPTHAHSGN